MAQRNPVSYPFAAGATVNPSRIVKIGAANSTVIQAAAASDRFVGVSDRNVTRAAGETVDVIIRGVTAIKAGGAISRGAAVTSDADGQAIAAAPDPGENVGVIGYALESAVSGDLVTVTVAPQVLQGAAA